MRQKARRLKLENVIVTDGFIAELPFPDDAFDTSLGGHVFGDRLDEECAELIRVTRPGGLIALCPGNGDSDNARHAFLPAHGFSWARFEEPEEGWVRKYWRRLPS